MFSEYGRLYDLKDFQFCIYITMTVNCKMKWILLALKISIPHNIHALCNLKKKKRKEKDTIKAMSCV